MATGLEMMAAKMLGLTPDALAATVEGFKNMVEDFAARLERIETQTKANGEALNKVLALLEAQAHDDGNGGSSPG